MRKKILGELELNRIYQRDCLEGMKLIPDGSIDLILCDPPYGTAGGMGKGEVRYKRLAESEWDVVLDKEKMFTQYERILRENGTIIIFSQEPYTSSLRSYKVNNIDFSYPLVWKKDHFANCLLANKAPVSYFEDISVFHKKYDIQNLNPLRAYFGEMLKWLGLNSCKDINKLLGHRRAEHAFYIHSTQFKLCTEKTYQELIENLSINKWYGFKEFNELEQINKQYKRVFNLLDNKKYMSNVLEFKKDYQGLHPTQKPIKLIEYLINVYTNDNDIVLDNCMGSGTTAVASVLNNRRFIGFETELEYIEVANKRLDSLQIN